MRPLIAFLLVAAAAAAAEQPWTIAVDVQEWRDQPSRHLYIQGTINGDTVFQLRLPPKEEWRDRLLHWYEGAFGGNFRAGEGQGEHAYALANGAAYVESSQGHRGPALTEKDTFREVTFEANYAVVQYARIRCVEFYGRQPRFVYAYGASGGGMRSSGMLERFPGLYDGVVPFVGVGSASALFEYYSLFEENLPPLTDKAAAMADEMRPGGSGDPFTVLSTPAQKAALETLLKAGYSIRRLDQLVPSWVSIQLMEALYRKADAAYAAEAAKEKGMTPVAGEIKAVAADKGLIETTVEAAPAALLGRTIRFTSGAAAGDWRLIWAAKGPYLAVNPYGRPIAEVRPGDRFVIDDRELAGWRSYHRRLRTRPPEVRESLDESDRPVGHFHGKMIIVYSLDDQFAWPGFALRYRKAAEKAWGAELDTRFRLHLFEYIPHGPLTNQAWEVTFRPALRKAMDDMMTWVENGVAPQPGTRYTLDRWGLPAPAATAEARKGYQPVATLAANGRHGRLETAAGAAVSFQASAGDPDNELARLEMDFEGDGKYDASEQVRGRAAKAAFRHSYPKPGTYFATLRATDMTSSRGSNQQGIQNLAHVRVLVK